MSIQWSNESLDEIKEHKKRVIKMIQSRPECNHGKDYYPSTKMIQGINCGDTDYIPKIVGAGEIFNQGSEPYQLMHNGLKLVQDAYNGTWMADLIYGLKGHHEPQEEKVFYEVLKQMPAKATMIELGSWWAYYSLWFARQVADPTIYLVEPDPERLNTGRRNLELNQVKGMSFRGYLSSRPTCSADFNGARQIYIDSFLEEQGIEHVNILHSDIQGAEYEMLMSANKSIQMGKIDYFFISTHSDSHVHSACIQFLLSKGCTILAEHSLAESFSNDGLVVAKRQGMPGPDRIEISKFRKSWETA